MTAIIILNWNGADDTLACLDSLSNADGEFVVYVVDNGSADDSVLRIQSWIDEHNEVDVRLVPLDKNYGFAKGNNKGLEVASKISPDSYLLLNNDTEVLPDFLVRLQDFSARHPKYRVLTPKINFYYDKQKVWNCGGKLFFGFRKYFYAGSPDSAVKENGHIDISFVTGCALFFYPELLDEKRHLLTERFFFGEEDYEFSLRMRNLGVRMACVPQSVVYHKVGSSQKNTKDSRGLGRIYMYYHNRLVCNRLYENRLKFYTICLLNSITCLKYFKKYSGSFATALKLVWNLLKEVQTKDTFDYDDFRSLMFENSYFDFDVKLK